MVHILVILFSLSLFAQEVETLETIDVTHQGTSNTLVDFVPSVTTLKTNELRKRREITLGDTLRSEPGVQSSSFGPNASRPVVRGLDGDRIRVLQNGLGVLDASAQSVDHAVPVDTLVIDSIEVVRGPMSMLYGSSAVGGVVNINTTRIHSAYEQGAISEFQLQGDSSQDALGTGAKMDYGTKNWMFHLDGGYRNANDLKIPGDQKSDRLGDTGGEFDGKDKLPNSASVQKSAAVGASRIFNKGYVGMSYYFFDNFYGTVAEEAVDIKMKQNRVELHGEYKFDNSILNSVRLKTAQSDYSHKELEGGEVGTTFANEGNETRLELMTTAGMVKGISGVQSHHFNFSAAGEEAFLPTTKNHSTSIFTLQQILSGESTYSVGARAENSNIDVQNTGGKERNFNGLNGSLGYGRKIVTDVNFNSSLSYSERLPNAQELFASGAHLATGIFEQGDEDLKKEKAFAVEAGVKYETKDEMLSLNVYTQKFKDYIALINTNVADTDSGFDIYNYEQVDAIFYGFEVDSKKKIGATPFNVIVRGDLVRAKNTDSGKNLPRISPPRATLGLEWAKDHVLADVEAQYNFEQTKTSPDEERTDSFTLLNAGMTYDLIQFNGKYSFFGRVKNILNQEARLHTSTLKEIAPLAGRHVVAGVQLTY
jgi:iron complex outermembrane receptor protein